MTPNVSNDVVELLQGGGIKTNGTMVASDAVESTQTLLKESQRLKSASEALDLSQYTEERTIID